MPVSSLGAETAVNPLPSSNPSTSGLKILVVDDHDIIRRGLKDLLNARAGWEVCAEAKTGKEAVALAEQLKPHIVVMDISMPDLNGLEASRQIHKAYPGRPAS